MNKNTNDDNNNNKLQQVTINKYHYRGECAGRRGRHQSSTFRSLSSTWEGCSCATQMVIINIIRTITTRSVILTNIIIEIIVMLVMIIIRQLDVGGVLLRPARFTTCPTLVV